MKCPNCGKEIAEKSKSCEFCGAEIVKHENPIPVRMIVEIILAIIIIGLGVLWYFEHQQRRNFEAGMSLTDAQKDFVEAKSDIAEVENEVLIKRLALEAAKAELLKIEEEAETKDVAINFTENVSDINMKMVWVEGGEFLMGATEEQGRSYYSCEKPVHQVSLDGFYIGMCEITQYQWKKIMETTLEQQKDSAKYKYTRGVGDDYPMYFVNWNEASDFCKKLCRYTGKQYALPSEAQWEYAARGGENADGKKYAGSNNIDLVARYDKNSNYLTHQCGTKHANSLGIYDMSGNVWEWCADWYGSYKDSVQSNPTGPKDGKSRVIRGGCWWSNCDACRITNRSSESNVERRNDRYGFRVVCNLSVDQKSLYKKLVNARSNVNQAERKVEAAEKRAKDAYDKLEEAAKKVKELQKVSIKRCPEGYVNLGLPSGTYWKNTNEEGWYTFDEALDKFGYNLPTSEQFIELREQCKWHRVDGGYNIVGPSGDSIFLPTTEYRNCADERRKPVDKSGGYWSYTPLTYEKAGELLYGKQIHISDADRSCEQSVRVVQ